ncbi:MAG TPA: hypothetical protein VLT36_25055 [Candidatus Dormibacteraeota bacterium]|nr:hypothetical protein [Candidatus Dormibacteraeota bacterium]
MTTRAEAVAFFTSLGFYAKERDWSMGATIIVISGAEQSSTPYVMTYRAGVYLYPRDGLWSIYNLKSAHPVADERRLSLREACDAVVELFNNAS